MHSFKSAPFAKEQDVTRDVKVIFHPAGHILGAAITGSRTNSVDD